MKVITFSRFYPAEHPMHGQHTNFKAAYDFHGIAKGTTIRAGNRWKAGDVFQPRIWTGKPYQSPQLAFMPELTILGTQSFEHDGKGKFFLEGSELGFMQVQKIAAHDGLSPRSFVAWFSKPFKGQRLIFGRKAFDTRILSPTQQYGQK